MIFNLGNSNRFSLFILENMILKNKDFVKNYDITPNWLFMK